jgi:aminoglycoside phosphotransferase (APT) family kinase protein
MPDTVRAVPSEFAQALRELGLAGCEQISGVPLTGGVSSDIWRIDCALGQICVKRALSKLRVSADWHAPVERNQYEARWMRVAQLAAPGSAPRVLGQHPTLGVLAMAYLPPASHQLWKQLLSEEKTSVATARAVGQTLAQIHSYSAARPALANQFDADQIFFDIRLEPYLLATAEKHADLARALQSLVTQTQANKHVLVHGDVSPKNILVGVDGPVFLDAECACWGDPAFDLAFCLNHLLLKCLWRPAASSDFLDCFIALMHSYLDAVDWEPPAAVEQRTAALLPGLFLARVDGKSPVEYITTHREREAVRRTARAFLLQPTNHLADVCAAWAEEIKR